MTTTHHLEKDMPLERLLNFLYRYAWFRKTGLFIGNLICILCWGVIPLIMVCLSVYGGYKVIKIILAFVNSPDTFNF